MGTHCRHCQAQLSRDEYFWFEDSCCKCEKFRQIVADERAVSIKSPLLAYVAALFFIRRLRHKFTAYLRRANIV